MFDFNNLPDEQKAHYHEKLHEYAQRIGGVNFLLQLIEGIRETSPHPLTASSKELVLNSVKLKWNKVIFNDNLQLLIKTYENGGKGGNLLPKKEAKGFKKTLNLLRMMKPIIFTVMPAHREDGSGFIFQPFEIVSETNTKLNFIFEILFFTSVANTKEILNYQVKH
jgi:hypothetical protein